MSRAIALRISVCLWTEDIRFSDGKGFFRSLNLGLLLLGSKLFYCLWLPFKPILGEVTKTYFLKCDKSPSLEWLMYFFGILGMSSVISHLYLHLSPKLIRMHSNLRLKNIINVGLYAANQKCYSQIYLSALPSHPENINLVSVSGWCTYLLVLIAVLLMCGNN